MFSNPPEFISVNFKWIFKIRSALINIKGLKQNLSLSRHNKCPLMNLWFRCLCCVNIFEASSLFKISNHVRKFENTHIIAKKISHNAHKYFYKFSVILIWYEKCLAFRKEKTMIEIWNRYFIHGFKCISIYSIN